MIHEGPSFTPLEVHLATLSSRYGITMDLDQVSSRKSAKLGFATHISYDNIPYAEALDPVTTIREELGLYPPSYINSIPLRMIVLVRNLKESSYAGKIPDIGGIAVPSKGLLYLDIGMDAVSIIQNLHHEISHFSDGDISILRGRTKRKEWVRLNPAKASAYRVNDAYISDRNVETERPSGFASLYGTFSPEEDRAEVALLLMTMSRAYGGYLKGLMERDEFLSAKILAIVAGIRQRSGVTIGSGFLEDLQNRRVNEQYWDSKVE